MVGSGMYGRPDTDSYRELKTMTTTNNDPTVPLTSAAAAVGDGYHNLFTDYALLQRVAQLESGATTASTGIDALRDGVVAYSEFSYSGQPTAGQTWTIGSNVYEARGAAASLSNDAYIAVLIGSTADDTYANLVAAINGTAPYWHASIFQTDGETAALGRGTANVVASQDATGNVVYLYRAATPGGTKLKGAPGSIALSDTVANGGPWKLTNLNTSVGIETAKITKQATVVHTVAAGDLTASQPLLVPVPFAPVAWRVAVFDANGVPRAPYIEVTVPTAVNGQNFLGLNLNDATPTGANKSVVTIPAAAAKTCSGYWAPPSGRDVRITNYETVIRNSIAGGTLTGDVKKTTAAGSQTNWATAAAIASSTNDPTSFTPDDVALPHDLGGSEYVELGNVGGSGLTAPTEVTWIVTWAEKVVATDKLMITVYGV